MSKLQSTKGKLIDRSKAQKAYDNALNRFKESKFSDAISELNKLQPKTKNIHYLLGACYFKIEDYNEAIKNFYLSPETSETLFNLGAANHKIGNISEARKYYRKAIDKFNDIDAKINLSIIHLENREYQVYIEIALDIIKVKPNIADTHINIIHCLVEIKEYDRAIEFAEHSRRVFSLNKGVELNYIRALDAKGLTAAALAATEELIEHGLVGDDVNYTKAQLKYKLRQIDSSMKDFESIINNNAENLNIKIDFARKMLLAGDYNKAESLCNDIIEINQANNDANYLLANIFDQKGEYDKALIYALKAQNNNAQDPYLNSLIVQIKQKICNWENLDNHLRLFDNDQENNKLNPFTAITFITNQTDLTNHARNWSKDLNKLYTNNKITTIKKNSNKIQVAYFSADLYNHATSILIMGMLRNHDRSKFAIHIYSFGSIKEDAYTQTIKSYADSFTDISQFSDKAVAMHARERGIDISVDLKGYTHNNRSQIFAYRSAPIQINFLGFPSSMGADFIDYIIADKYLIPDHLINSYHEKVIRLPVCYQPNDDKRDKPILNTNRNSHNLPEGSFVFCCFNNNYKITPNIFNIWCEVLLLRPTSILWLLEDNKEASSNLMIHARKQGVLDGQIIFTPRMGNNLHLERHLHANLFVDTYPCNAHTTASDSLWAGLPVLTISGETFPSRVAGSLLHHLGITDLIANSYDDYKTKLLEFIDNPSLLSKLKSELIINTNLCASYNSKAHTKYIEEAYIKMIEIHNSSARPFSFDI